MIRRVLVAVAALGLVLASSALAAPAGAADTEARAIGGSVLRWGLSNETNNRAFAPGTFNYLSAGILPNPGRGGTTFPQSVWKQRSGDAAIEKRQAGGGYAAATWAGLRTDASGVEISSATSGRFTDHQVVLSGGTGWADPTTGRAQVRWDADFTVVYYSGYTFFHVSDPTLSVAADGTGTLTATLSGYGSSMEDLERWDAIAPRRVVLATLGDVDVTADGVRVIPDYAGVRFDAPAGVSAQVRSGSGWGAWPASFTAFQVQTGQAPYWYTSGGSSDAYKVPLPITTTWALGERLEIDPVDPSTDPVDPVTPTTPPTPRPTTPAPTTGMGGATGGTSTKTVKVTDAQLRWGMNDESNNRAFAPGTVNFFSAGKVPDPGKGGTTLPRSAWKATAGSVAIEKRTTSGGYRRATWDGLGTTASGAALGAPGSNTEFSDHQVVLGRGRGTVEPAKKRATISWEGSWTVLYYSGMSFSYVSDPVLQVRDGRGTVTAELGGFSTSMDDLAQWRPLTPRRVVIADLGTVSLTGAKGTSVTPRYGGVRYTAPAGATAQVRSRAGWGSWPASFVDFQQRTGQAAYWYSSGGQTDAHKAPLPLTVSWDATSPATQRVPDSRASAGTAAAGSAAGAGGVSPAQATGRPGAAAPAVPAVPTVQGLAASPTSTTLEGATVRPVATATGPVATWMWWTGAALLILSAAVGAVTTSSGRRPAVTERGIR
ncbi:hypothetical protein [Solicola sp. PLA-1-18]|uniref:hypothetical protein n=1 Tax=Solicola sp. PLA-1-18 TaxID=3380532 RepID=UPI003B7A4D4F